MTQQRFIFITGASRSGTTLLSFVLRKHAEVFGLRELQYFGRWWDPREPERRFTRAEAVEAAADLYAYQEHGVLLHHVDPKHRLAALGLVNMLGPAAQDPAELFAAVVQSLAHAAGKSIPCEQTPRYIFYAQPLLDRYPGAHVVHMVRDPRAVMASQKNRWRRRSLAVEGAAAVPRYESVRVWVNYHPYTVARLWSRATRAALDLAEHPRFTLLRYEDLVAEPEATVRALCRRLGIDFDPAMLEVDLINSSHQSSAADARKGMRTDAIDRWRKALTGAETAVTERYCAPLMRRFGYAPVSRPRMAWLDRLGFGFSYVVHLAAVMVVNPRRAAVQLKAIVQSDSAESMFRRVRQSAPRLTHNPCLAIDDGPRSEPKATDAAAKSLPPVGAMREFIGLRFWDVELSQAARFVVERAAQGIRTRVFFVNAHCVNEAARQPRYAALLANAPFVFADGVGMAIAARFSGLRLQHNVNGTDLFPLICQTAAEQSVPIALLGAKPGVAEACAERMMRLHPGLRVVWTAHGYMTPEEERASLAALDASGARILFVAKGVPAQECWIDEHASELAVPVVLGVGALLDFYSGRVRRAPRLVRELRSEWLYRLMLEPRRLSRRYLLGNPAFIARALLWRSMSHPLARRDGGLT